ncbi:MAG: hypothetical protein ABUR63_05610 [Verrucomicrobiota bacterium]
MRRTSSFARRALCSALLAMMVTACEGNKSINEPGGSGGTTATGSGGGGGEMTGGTGGTGGSPGTGGSLGTGGRAASGGNSGTGGSGPGTGGVGGVGGGSPGSGGTAIGDAGTTSDGAPPSDAGCPNPASALSYMTTGCGASAPAPLCLIQYLCIVHACSCTGTIISGCQSFQQPFAYIYETQPPDGGDCDPNTPPPR